MVNAQSEVVLVTDAGSGIGRELVRLFLADGVQVLAAGPVQSDLDELVREHADVGARLQTVAIDLSQPAALRLCSVCPTIPTEPGKERVIKRSAER